MTADEVRRHIHKYKVMKNGKYIFYIDIAKYDSTTYIPLWINKCKSKK